MTHPSALTLRTQGVHVRRTGPGARLQVTGPKDDALRALVKAEIDRRLSMCVGVPPLKGYGRCEWCGDPIEHYRSGDCDLCAVARQKVCDAKV